MRAIRIRLCIASTTAIIMTVWTNALRSVPSARAFSTQRTGCRWSTNLALAASTNAKSKRHFTTPVAYSQATRRRIEGLDAATEFNKLASQMNKSPEVLKVTLQRRFSSSGSSGGSGAATVASGALGTEKEEYLHWILSGVDDDGGGDGDLLSPDITTAKKRAKKKKGTANAGAKKNGHKPILAAASAPPGGGETKQTYQTDVRFDDAQIPMHRNSRKALAEMGLTHMTEIQSKTYTAASTGSDVLGRARTGTGKTVAFLLPAIERLVRDGTIEDPTRVGMLVVSPTRELATQIGDQASQLLKHHRGSRVQVMFGGTNMKTDVKRLSGRKGLPTVLVATPGRLLDHMTSTRLERGNNRVSFGEVMGRTDLIVLDETDRLLDMGFRRDIERILDFMPSSQRRQTLLFSATMPPELKVIMKRHMKRDYVEVDCIRDGDAATHTNDRVAQSHFVLPSKEIDAVTCVVETVRYAVETHIVRDEEGKEDGDGSWKFRVPPKIVVFFPTARLVQFYAKIFEQVTNGIRLTEHTLPDATTTPFQLPSWELHSKKSQGYRNRVSNEFREATSGVLFTSDVSARGVDYPNVSHVIQFGIPESREQYIHRLGRTGRAGSKGKGWLVLQSWEAKFLKELKGVDIPPNEELATTLLENDISEDSSSVVWEVRRRVRGGDGILSDSGSAAYSAFLGYYKGQMKRLGMRNAEHLVDIANDFASSLGFEQPPQLKKSTVGKMGLKGVAGLNVAGGGGGGGGGGSLSGNRDRRGGRDGGGGGRRAGRRGARSRIR